MKSSTKKWMTALLIVIVGAAVVAANMYRTRRTGKVVTVETVQARDLTAVVSASGKIQAKRTVNISADNMGRVTRLAVEEGQRVRRGDFLLQIDPQLLSSAVQQGQAGVSAARSQLAQMQVAIEAARETLALAQITRERERELWAQQLTTRQAVDQAENAVKLREAELRQREQDLTTQQQRIRQEEAMLSQAQFNLSRVRIESPIDGIVTRRNIEEGETVVIGTMNNPGTVLLTIADMAIIDAEVEVDETDIPMVRIGQSATITVDAMPGRELTGRVTEIGNSPIQTSTGAAAAAGQQATNFMVKVTLDEALEELRPGFTCTARITTATREQATAVPIQAMAVRDVTYDASGQVVREPRESGARGGVSAASPDDLPSGHTRRETEGVFVMDGDRAVFTPVRTGIAGDRYFEVLDGLAAGARVVTGPFNSVRDLQDGDEIRLDDAKKKR
jgi:HlyD family secretion protein